ncbi:sulfite exporter TauE/SafE family protein [Metabacillus halosaccharovorans]|uniref:sulfite exporter TauE/SafE family protein n=1 Tax=Metabacillus halosaccharovorans TaxID=930124 RepID=UPI00203DA2E3|nr:sulfite exporter TauE/SafE family protein [Metabacillus halosaccharovorans]MCM3443127.1 sulfite exporter TauE/SafE family protein [Metabacillus halosaccharovorans]
MDIIIIMLLLGIILGFVGAGGSGFIIAILVTFFHIPVHLALGTAVAVMFFSVLSGSWGHFQAGNLYVKQGLFIGLFGGVGGYIGSQLTRLINPDILLIFTITSLILSGLLIWLKTKITIESENDPIKAHKVYKLMIIGLGNGFISGTLGIGAASFIQISLLKWIGLPLRVAAGTTMLIILPIALGASFGFIQAGYFEPMLFLKVALGTVIGSYLGAKLTKKAPQIILRLGMVATPVVSGVIMLWNFL